MRLRTLVAAAVVTSAAIALSATCPVRAQLAPRDQDQAAIQCAGGCLLVWSEDRGAGHRIYAKRVFSNGWPVGGAAGGEWEVTGAASPAGKGDQLHPAVDGDLLVWSERVPTSGDYDLYGQRLTGNGRGHGAVRLLVGGPGNQFYADLATSTNRSGLEWLLVWSEDTRDAGDVMGLRLTAALTGRGAPFAIAQGPGTAEDPVIAPDPTAERGYVVLWTDDRNGNKDIYGTRIASTGLPRGGPTAAHFAVVKSPEDDYAAVMDSYWHLGGAALWPGGEYGGPGLLVYNHDDVTDGPDVMGHRIEANGMPVGKPIPIVAGPGRQLHPACDRGQLVWSDDSLGSLDILGSTVLETGIRRRQEHQLVTD